MYEQLDIFDMTRPEFQIDKPIRLIELFAGVGSQAMALRDLGANFEHYRVVEFDRFAIASYNAIHRTDFKTTDIRDISGADLGICDTLTTVQKDNMILIGQATKEGFVECEYGGVADLSFPTSGTRRGRVQDKGNICPTITAETNGLCRIESQYRIRKLTPLECWRLMGFSDEDFYKAEEVNSNTQLYKQAGNSIVKNVLMAIFGQMMSEKENIYK